MYIRMNNYKSGNKSDSIFLLTYFMIVRKNYRLDSSFFHENQKIFQHRDDICQLSTNQ